MTIQSTARWLIGACAFALLTAGFAAAAQAEPKRLPNAKATDCAACHGAQKVLPPKHKPIKNQKLADCHACHDPKDADSALQLPLSHAHMLAGIGCTSCHGKGKPAALTTADCVQCHDVDELVKKTGGHRHNPHKSPHYGTDLDCDNCHVAHGKSQDYCAQCHDFKFRVP